MDDFYTATLPIYFIKRLFGLLPFKYTRDGVKVSPFGFLYSIGIISLLCWVFSLRIRHVDSYKQVGSFISKMTLTVLIFIGICVIICVVILASINRYEIDKFMETFINIDKKVEFTLKFLKKYLKNTKK